MVKMSTRQRAEPRNVLRRLEDFEGLGPRSLALRSSSGVYTLCDICLPAGLGTSLQAFDDRSVLAAVGLVVPRSGGEAEIVDENKLANGVLLLVGGAVGISAWEDLLGLVRSLRQRRGILPDTREHHEIAGALTGAARRREVVTVVLESTSLEEDEGKQCGLLADGRDLVLVEARVDERRRLFRVAALAGNGLFVTRRDGRVDSNELLSGDAGATR
jgi:hypothetical protein